MMSKLTCTNSSMEKSLRVPPGMKMCRTNNVLIQHSVRKTVIAWKYLKLTEMKLEETRNSVHKMLINYGAPGTRGFQDLQIGIVDVRVREDLTDSEPDYTDTQEVEDIQQQW